jgi:hypothetical protein
MEIKIPIKFHGNYVLSIRSGEKEDRERCQKLTIRQLSAEEQAHAYNNLAPEKNLRNMSLQICLFILCRNG